MREIKLTRCCNAEAYIGGRHGGRTLRVYCSACKKLQDTYRFALERWTEEDLDEFDSKFDALCEYLNIEFVFERVSDGSEFGDKERVFIRKKE